MGDERERERKKNDGRRDQRTSIPTKTGRKYYNNNRINGRVIEQETRSESGRKRKRKKKRKKERERGKKEMAEEQFSSVGRTLN